MLSNRLRAWLHGGVFAALASATGQASADWALNMPRGVTPTSRDVYDLHMLILWICVVIGIVVFGAMVWSIIHHRRSRGADAAQFHHSTLAELVWTGVPFLILVGMAIPATRTLIAMEDTTASEITIKVTGYQWKWRYDYLEEGISFYSNLAPSSREAMYTDARSAEHYLLDVDNPVVVPVGKKIRFLLTSDDVIHAWWVPALGMKKDAIPGFINEIWALIDEDQVGIYRGQCAELCGKDHGFMPVVLDARTVEDYEAWVREQNGAESKPQTVAASASESSATGAADTATEAEASAAASEEQGSSTDATPEESASGAPSVEAGSSTAAVTEEAASGSASGEEGSSTQAAAAEDMSRDEIMARGKQVYTTNCMACHGAEGAGIPGAFPALTGGAITTGPLAEHVSIVVNGKAGTAMVAFGAQLSDADIAAVVTYERNALGNSLDDVATAADVAAAR